MVIEHLIPSKVSVTPQSHRIIFRIYKLDQPVRVSKGMRGIVLRVYSLRVPVLAKGPSHNTFEFRFPCPSFHTHVFRLGLNLPYRKWLYVSRHQILSSERVCRTTPARYRLAICPEDVSQEQNGMDHVKTLWFPNVGRVILQLRHRSLPPDVGDLGYTTSLEDLRGCALLYHKRTHTIREIVVYCSSPHYGRCGPSFVSFPP